MILFLFNQAKKKQNKKKTHELIVTKTPLSI